jgi:hypothetical protein
VKSERGGNSPADETWLDRVYAFPRFPHAFFLGSAGGGSYRCVDCDSRGGPECYDLITNPAWVFSDRANHPDHASDYIMQETVERWARSFVIAGTLDYEPGMLPPHWWEHRDQAHPQGGELALQAWQRSWPIILGKAALERAIREGDFPPESAPQRLLNIVPFDGYEYGAVICSAVFDDTIVSFFGIAIPEYDGSGSPTAFKGGLASFRIVGPQPNSPEVGQFVQHAQRWWSPFGGQSIRPGRPVGSTKRSIQWYIDQFRSLASEMKREPTEEQFCERCDVDRKTLRVNLSAFGCWPWNRFKERAGRARTVRR